MLFYRKSKLYLIEILIILLLFIQIISLYLLNNNIIKDIMLLFTGIFMFLLIIKLFFREKNADKMISWYIAILCGYILFFAINSYINKNLSFIAETKQIIPYMSFPIMLSCFINKDRQNKFYNTFFCIYGFLNIVLLLVFNIYKQVNFLELNKGLFVSLIIIYPTILFNIISQKQIKNKIPFIILSILSLYFIIRYQNALFNIIIICISIYYLILSININILNNRKWNNILLIILFITILALSFYKLNIFNTDFIESKKSNNYNIENNYYDTLYKFQNKPKYSDNAFVETYNIYAFNYKNETAIQKIFGVGVAKNRIKNKIDPIEILCGYGIIGFLLCFYPLIYVLYQMIKSSKTHKFSFIDNCNIQAGYISIFIIIVLSIFSGNVLISSVINILSALIIYNVFSIIPKKKNENSRILNIKNIAIIILFVILLLLINKLFTKTDNILKYVDITFENGLINLNNSNLKIKKVNHNIVKSNYAYDDLTYYNITQNGEVKLKIILANRKFDENLTYNYITAQNISNNKIHININTGKYEKYFDLDNYAKEKEYSTTVGYDKTSLPSKYITYNNKYSLGYNTHVYKTISVDYDNINHSIIKELLKKVSMTKLTDDEMGYTFDLNNEEYFDTLIVNSNNRMFENEEQINKYIDIYDSNLSSGWLSFDGSYIKLPYSIEPYTKDGYGRNIGSNLEKGFLDYYFNDENLFFKSHILLSIHILKNYLPQYENSVWLTEYTSTWLSKDYGIKAFYVDTRHNDTISGYLRAIAEKNKDQEITKMSRYYAKYLLDEYNNKNYVSFKYGILPPDYFSNNNINNTHMSLNHQLSIINNLLTTYILTNNEEYKQLALVYLETIVNIGEDWIKDNNDLYYRINGNCEFDGVDYKELTLDDLLVTKDLLKKIDIVPNTILDKLINSKIKYLKDINYNINQELIEKLQKRGYIN